jgi:acyl-coenzyme A synthetase/AMP-(fatty) acid ligase
MLYLLSTGGCVITVRDRTPEGVLRAVEKYGAELLPTSPTFINLILLSEAHKNHDLSSLKTVTYGTEPMPESTLKRFHKLFPQITLQQTYGLSEVGIPGSKSQSSDSLWVKIGGNGFETRVVDGILQIRAQSAMMGYLNAPNPFTDDGWFITGDMVEFDGEYYRILGRKSDIINVGGEKVYPAEIESILLGMPQVLEAVVTGEPNAIVGSIVKATIVLSGKEQLSDFRVRLNKYMQEKGVQTFKIPQKVILRKGDLHTSRFKKIRSV